MSSEIRKKKGFEPPGELPKRVEDEPPVDPAQQMRAMLQTFTDLNDHVSEQSQKQAEFFKKLFEESSLPFYVKMAGVSALFALILEVLHIAWLAWRYLQHF